jgi:hypothetical protein
VPSRQMMEALLKAYELGKLAGRSEGAREMHSILLNEKRGRIGREQLMRAYLTVFDRVNEEMKDA